MISAASEACRVHISTDAFTCSPFANRADVKVVCEIHVRHRDEAAAVPAIFVRGALGKALFRLTKSREAHVIG